MLKASKLFYLIILGLPSKLNHLLVPRLSVQAGCLVGVCGRNGRRLRGQPVGGRDKLSVDVLVVRERSEALLVLRAVLTPAMGVMFKTYPSFFY